MVMTKRQCLTSYATLSKRPSQSITKTGRRFRRRHPVEALPARCMTSHNGEQFMKMVDTNANKPRGLFAKCCAGRLLQRRRGKGLVRHSNPCEI